MKKIMVVLAMLVIFVLSLPLVSFALNFSSLGTATVDGTMAPGEWDKAAKIDFRANLPLSEGGGSTPATLYIMNDEKNLYFALKIARSSYGPQFNFMVDFDNDNDGFAELGDDAVGMIVGNYLKVGFEDLYRYYDAAGIAKSQKDTNPEGAILPAGSNDIETAASSNGSFVVIELSHPFAGGDAKHDISMKPGASVGFKPAVLILGKGGLKETTIPVSETAGGYGQITVASKVITIAIDIKPGNGSNTINSKSEGKLPVAILSTPAFKAPETVDTTSLKFGRTGDESSLAFCNKDSQDVDGDGEADLVCHFSTPDAGFYSTDTAAILTGQTTDGQRFMGKDSVRLVR